MSQKASKSEDPTPRCVTCGETHDVRVEPVPPFGAFQKYKEGLYSCPVPPMPSGRWTEDSWVRWITNHGVWL
jgi:hypothetical protein